MIVMIVKIVKIVIIVKIVVIVLDSGRLSLDSVYRFLRLNGFDGIFVIVVGELGIVRLVWDDVSLDHAFLSIVPPVQAAGCMGVRRGGAHRHKQRSHEQRTRNNTHGAIGSKSNMPTSQEII
ncbi:hypothetical protein H257_08456 [Aphanomyces astaci]|uniref:Uncharacterized protein n=1 Tax=Aphanomyces astaci TaxID=112090 RepID=W4GEX8_APHAT|nr:hypothetical protein H257_08456 [Aphanomyces astaci]ETV77518.1 hypothetical protein H257_08456 [Aphanomyces astaci]|eukprot:XP_009832628.1 hypothetical protein H257_08456 [Aphanomyces astaci]